MDTAPKCFRVERGDSGRAEALATGNDDAVHESQAQGLVAPAQAVRFGEYPLASPTPPRTHPTPGH